MKKVISTLLTLGAVLLLLPSISAAQTPLETEKGLMLGLNFSNLKGDDADSIGTDSKTGVIGGVFLRYKISPSLAIEPQLLITMKGAEAPVLGFETKLKLTYLELPVLFRFTIPTQGNVTPSIFVGPSAGFILSSKGTASSPGFSVEADLENTKGIEFGLVIGGGITVGSNDTKIFLDGRYNLGLTNVFEDVITPGPFDIVKDAAGTAPDFKNNGFAIILGVML